MANTTSPKQIASVLGVTDKQTRTLLRRVARGETDASPALASALAKHGKGKAWNLTAKTAEAFITFAESYLAENGSAAI